MKAMMLTMAFVLCVTITGCDNYGEETRHDTVNDVAGLSLEIKANTVSESGLTVIIRNSTQNEYTFGSIYWVEKKINDKWYQVPDILENTAWSAVGYPVVGSSFIEMEINWEWINGKLSAGNYRVIKDCSYSRSPGDYDKYYVSAEFIIE